jgi:holo-ACP synthase / triphosphoribosyl-dephospho-CoA synthase
MVFEFGLPQMEGVTSLNDEILIRSFLAIAANNNDTNIVHRSNPSVLSEFQMLCKEALEYFDELNYSKVIDFCKNKKISPGGSADLLAVTIFVWLVIKADENLEFANFVL